MSHFENGGAGPIPGEDLLREVFGFLPSAFRLQAPLGEIAEQQAKLLHVLLAEGQPPASLTRRQKEQIFLAVSAAREAHYGTALHAQMLSALGANDPEIQAILGGETGYPDAPLVRYARKAIESGKDVGQEDVDRLLAAGYSNGQIVEAAVCAGICDLLNTMQFATGAAPDFTVPEVMPRDTENIPHPQEPDSALPVHEVTADPDAELVAKAQAGDLEAFEALVNAHNQRVFRLLAGLLADTDLARDAMQDTFLKAFENLAGFEGRAKFSTWLTTIAHNTGLQRLREQRPTEPLNLDERDETSFRPLHVGAWAGNPEQLYSAEERRRLVERAIAGLPLKYRTVLMLRDVQQISTEDTAASLNLSISAVKARLLRGRLMLREALAPHFSPGAAA
jgi:RNA polymerase sigma-70 factor (ECF subfamily)